MIYIGIVGALSPLGQETVRLLKEKNDLYRIVFYVDAGYRVSSPMNATYASPEAALSFNQPPTLIIDCDDPVTAVERAKTYRFYAVSAIMCCTCMPEELDDLRCSYVADNQQVPALFITPDYIVKTVLLMHFFLGIAANHCEDFDHLEVNVRLPLQKRINLARWLYFGRLMNDRLGRPEAKYNVSGSVCNFGEVVIKVVNDDSLMPDAQEINAKLFYGYNKYLCYTYMRTFSDSCLKDRVHGISLMLEWFAAHPKEVADGGVFIDHLIKVAQDIKKNLL